MLTKGFISFHSLEYVCNQQGSEYDHKGFPDLGSSETPINLKSDSCLLVHKVTLKDELFRVNTFLLCQY